jgi:hypothetical protein
MGGVYSRFFKGCTQNELDGVCFIDYKDFDTIFKVVFGYKVAPPRKNVGKEKIFHLSDCDNPALEALISKDVDIVQEIKKRIINPTEIHDRMKG